MGAVVQCAELADRRRIARLLSAELVARKSQDFKAPGMIFLIKRLKPLILGRKAALARRIDDEQDLAAEVGKRFFFSVQ